MWGTEGGTITSGAQRGALLLSGAVIVPGAQLKSGAQ